ncbi:UNVERIFIED_CONTAM: hypothetical protein K2H54_008785 [Gekko kuhli]
MATFLFYLHITSVLTSTIASDLAPHLTPVRSPSTHNNHLLRHAKETPDVFAKCIDAELTECCTLSQLFQSYPSQNPFTNTVIMGAATLRRMTTDNNYSLLP